MFRTFCEQTSFHGWNLIALSQFKASHVVFWLLTIITSFLGLSYMVYRNTSNFNEAKVAFHIQSPSEPLDEVYFPAIYLINKNMFRKSVTQGFASETNLNVDDWYLFLDSLYIDGGSPDLENWGPIWSVYYTKVMDSARRRFIQQNNTTNITTIPSNTYIHHNHSIQYIEEWNFKDPDWRWQFYIKYHFAWFSHVNLEDFLLWLDFNGDGILHYGGGKADNNLPRNRFFPFYKEPSNINDIRSFVPFAKSGKRNGITFLLDVEAYDYAVCPSKSEGFILGISHHLDFELSENYGVDIHPGQQVHIGVSTRKIVTDEMARIRFLPQERECYYDEEIELPHLSKNYYRYSMGNCLIEAYVQAALKQCKCYPIFMNKGKHGHQECTAKYKTCMKEKDVTIGMYNTIINNGTQKTCYPNCIDQTFTKEVSHSKYPAEFPFLRSHEFCKVFLKLGKSCLTFKTLTLKDRYGDVCEEILKMNSTCNQTAMSDELKESVLKYTHENVIKVTVYLKDPFVEKIKREEKITIWTYVSNIGGLLGLFQGISILSFVEIIYFLFISICSKLTMNIH